MPEVIADTSAIQYLFQTGLLNVLNVLYGQITIPEAVVSELSVGRSHGVSLPDVSSISGDGRVYKSGSNTRGHRFVAWSLSHRVRDRLVWVLSCSSASRGRGPLRVLISQTR